MFQEAAHPAETGDASRMFTFERTFDYALLRYLMTRDRQLYKLMADDSSPTVDDYPGPQQSDAILYVLVRDGDQPMGYFVFAPQTAECWVIHTVMPMKGKAAEAGRGVLEWVWLNYPTCERIITWIPEHNKIAQRFARRAGLTKFAKNERSVRVGTLQSQIWMGISRPDSSFPPSREVEKPQVPL